MPRDVLPSIPPDSYRDVARELPPFEEIDQNAAITGNHFSDRTPKEKREDPLLPEEKTTIEGILKFIDHCLPSDAPRNRAVVATVRRSRNIALSVLAVCATSEIDLDDMRQEARLAVIRTARNFSPNRSGQHKSSILTLLPYGITNHIREVGGRAIRGGFISDPSITSRPPVLRPVSDVARTSFDKPVEADYSDKLHELYTHPDFFRKLDIGYIGISEADTEEWHSPFSNPTSEPRTPDQDSPGYIDEDPGLDRILSILENQGVELDDQTRRFMQLRYIEGYSLNEIAEMQEESMTWQAVERVFRNMLTTIRATPGLMEKLQSRFL